MCEPSLEKGKHTFRDMRLCLTAGQKLIKVMKHESVFNINLHAYHKSYVIPLKDRVVRDVHGEMLLQDILKKRDLGILWSHNEQKHPRWLDTIMQSCKSRLVWWDVGWQLVPDQFIFPLTGYIWNTVEKQATHRASIERVERQPSEKLAEEVRKSWRECNIHVNPNSPLLLHLRNKDKKCTLLKLAGLERLLHPGKLEDFILAKKGRPIKQAPQSVAIVIDPHLL